jgi:hypothetical protein
MMATSVTFSGGPVFLVFAMVMFGLWLWGLIDTAMHPGWAWRQAGHSKALWTVLEVVINPFLVTTLLYLLICRPGIAEAQRMGQGPGGFAGAWDPGFTGRGPGGMGGIGGPRPQQPTPQPPPFAPGGTSGAPGAGPEERFANNENPTLPPPAWHPDPSGRHQFRYWDGEHWTSYVADGAQQATDPI